MDFQLTQTGQQTQDLLNEVPVLRNDLDAEVLRSTNRDDDLETAIGNEKTRAEGAEGELQTAIGNEKTRAEGAEAVLRGDIGDNATSIGNEKTRAENAEGVLQGNIDAEALAREQADGTLQGEIGTINGKIPAQASSENKLADKSFVNSSIATNTADFKGTYNSLEQLEQVSANANDYGFVVSTDAAGNTVYNRYKYVDGTGWVFEYALNNSSFTAAQWAAIQSGITTALVAKLADLPTAASLTQQLNQIIASVTTEKERAEGAESALNTAIGDNATAIGNEKTRAEAAEAVLRGSIADNATAIGTEKTRAEGAEGTLQTSITNEKTRAEAAELLLQQNINAEATARDNADDALQAEIDAINAKIPAAASASNRLADKAFVNSSIATNTADFKGTYNSLQELQAVTGANANDYGFVIATDAAGNTVYNRYKYVEGTGWMFEYALNNSSFTSDQWAAINSGITALLVAKLSGLPDIDGLNAMFGAITSLIPSAATSSNKLVDYAQMVAALATKQNTLTFDSTPTENSQNPVTSDGLYTSLLAITNAIAGLQTSKQNVLTFDEVPTAGSDNPVKSKGIKSAIDSASSTLAARISTNEADIAALQALYNSLQQSAPQVIEPTDTWPVANPSTTVIYRVIDRVNTPPEYYSDYMWNGTAFVLMATYNNAIDDVPTAGSNNLVKSGGVYNALNKELIDTVYTGGWKGDGTETTSSGYYKTGKIPVKPNVLYYLSGNINTAILGGLAGIFLDSNSSVIQVIYKRGSTPITPDNPVVLIAPENAAYICLTFTGTNHSLKADLFSIAENNSKMISNLGKDFNTELAIGSNVANEYWKADGTTTTTTAAYIRTAKIPVKPYNVYHFKGSITSSIGNAKSLWFDSNNNVIGEVAELKNYPVTEVDIVAPEGAAYIAITSIGEFLPDLSLTLHYTGIHKAIEELGNRTTQIEENIIIDKTIKTVTCWGDSLTKGAGASNSYPEELQTLLGNTFTVSNYGHGGETANAIAFRKKGISVVVEPCTIVNGEWTTIQFKASNGLTLETLYSNANGTEGIRNLHFGDSKFMFVTTANPNEGKLYNSSGSDYVISRPTIAEADGDGNGHVIIICMGQNGYCSGKAAKDNPDAMISLHHRMINENNTKRYIVITPPSNNTQYWQDYESRFGSEFGRNFLNAREYISKYGLSDNNLTPTSQDEEAMAVGAIPPQLLSDSVHFNAYGYIAFANCIYKRGQELGYW